MSLTFHQTFPLDCENISRLLSLINADPSVSNENIAEATGIGIGKDKTKGKVQPTIDYAIYCGLITSFWEQGGRRLQITGVGKVLMKNDPWLKKPTSLWVMHFFLSRDGSDAEAWSFFAQEFLPRYGEFTRRTLEMELDQKFGDRAKIKSINLGVLLNCYLDAGAFEAIRLIRRKSGGFYVRTRPYIPNPFTVAYILAQTWEIRRPQRLMVSHDTLLEPGDLASTMSLTESDLQSWLDALTALGIIAQLREAPPYQVKPQWNEPLELLQRSYDED